MKLTKTVVTGAVLSLAFLANCDLIMGTTWHFTDAEMRAAVEGTWKLTRDGGEEITLVAKQASAPKHSARDRGFVSSAAACGSRSFVRQAAACSDSTDMPLEITSPGHKVESGKLVVYSTTFETGILNLTVDGSSLEAQLDRTGTVKRVTLTAPGKFTSEKVTLHRVAKI